MLIVVLALLLAAALQPALAAPLPGSAPWVFPQDIVAEQYRELREYYDRALAAAAAKRKGKLPDLEEFRRIIGAIDTLEKPKPKVERIGETAEYSVSLVEWQISRTGTLPSTRGFWINQYGVLLTPKRSGPLPAMIAIADAADSAADIAGLTSRLPADKQYARRLAQAGYIVFAPFFVQRRAFSEPWLDDRSWLFRLAYVTGRHPIGSEVLQVSSAVDYLSTLANIDHNHIGVGGQGHGELLAIYSAALDRRLQTAVAGGGLNQPGQPYDLPEDRMIWKQMVVAADQEIASAIAPRKLLRSFDELLSPSTAAGPQAPQLSPDREAQIANAQFSQWQMFYRTRALESFHQRAVHWRPDTSSIENYRRSIQPQLDAYFDGIGRYPDPAGPLEARSVEVFDEAAFTGHRLQVRVYDGVHAYGILVVPKGIPGGRKLPVVFTQHGYEGRPEDAIGIQASPGGRIYSQFGKRLAERGYIVFAPMISVQDGTERTTLVRQSHLLGLTPVGIELKKFGRVLDYLTTLPFVDIERCAFYGLSYGGYTALRIGPGEPRFKVVINSGDFNDTTVKNTDPTLYTSFLFHRLALDRYKFGWLNRLSDAYLASLIAPRAFMAEVGDEDGTVVEPRRLQKMEIDHYLDVYRRLGIPERGQVSYFHGPHEIRGTDAFPFLDKWLKDNKP